MATSAQVIDGLIRRGLPYHVALGIAGNMAVESDGFKTDVNEYAPVVPGSRGGYGLNQWTGPRRVQFEQFAQSRGVAPSDLDTQLDFTLWELQNTEQRAGKALAGAQTYEDAAQIYSEQFLRPGIPHLDRRLEATAALAGNNALAALQAAPQGQPQAAENALHRFQPVDTRIDPRAFQNALMAPAQTLTFDMFKV